MKTLTLLLALVFSGSVIAQNGTNANGMAKPTVDQLGNGLIKITKYHDNGMVAETGICLNGEKHGVWTAFDENGNKSMEASWNNGTKEGNWTVWHNNGTLHYLMVYENGKRLLSTEWDPNGTLIAGNQSK